MTTPATEAAAAAKSTLCPHCNSLLLWSEDRGAHCDGCDDFDPETDLPPYPAPEAAAALTSAKCDLPIKCCRCRLVHTENDRLKVPHKKLERVSTMVCPKCGAESYYRLRADGSIAKTHAECGMPKPAAPSSPLPAPRSLP